MSIRLVSIATSVAILLPTTSSDLSNTPIPTSASSLKMKLSWQLARKLCPAARWKRSEMMAEVAQVVNLRAQISNLRHTPPDIRPRKFYNPLIDFSLKLSMFF
jgi:hypothetical protein